ncbi:MAG: amidase family protein [Pseudohongiella sp.]|nr:amidase family protein [Pseudohongiella sp.]
MPPTITAFEQSPDCGQGLARDMTVRWAFEEVGQQYDVRLISFSALKDDAHRALQRFGQMPTYEEGDLVLVYLGAKIGDDKRTFPRKRFSEYFSGHTSLGRQWVEQFMHRYDHEHKHCKIRFVTSQQRFFRHVWHPSRSTTPKLFSAALLLIFTSNQPLNAASNDQPFAVLEASIPEMQQAMESGQMTSRELVEQYLIRIALYEERVNAVIAINPNALADADRLDAERAAGHVRGPLHGIPVALKDNIHTTDMPTTGGALVFRDFVPPYEATLTTNLRNAGAIIIAKTVMTELANFLGSGMPGNYSAIGGYGLNPYDPRRDPRQGSDDGRPVMGVGGSSSGIGTVMSFWAANVGIETSGSILSPANANMLAAIKPTVGRISRWGFIPITADQDTAGPMTRSVTDAAIAGIVVYLLLRAAKVPAAWAFGGGFVTVAGTRIAAITYDLSLPVFLCRSDISQLIGVE